jgi:hypothetical protein
MTDQTSKQATKKNASDGVVVAEKPTKKMPLTAEGLRRQKTCQ